MQQSAVVIWGDFRTFLQAFAEGPAQGYTGSLEEYLRALWAVVQRHRDDQPSPALFAQLILEALTESPPSFDESWLVYDTPADFSDIDPGLVIDSFSKVQHMLLYQIADQHRVSNRGALVQLSPCGLLWRCFVRFM